MINEIDILHESHCCYFACHTGKETAGLLCVVTYHHEIVVELGEYCFDNGTSCMPTLADASSSDSADMGLQE